MKIVYIALKYDYGDPKRGYSFEHYNFYDSLVKMNNGEHSIIYFPVDEMLNTLGRDEMNKKLLSVVKEEKPDLCFFFLYGDELKKEIVKNITESGIQTFNWFADDHWRFENYSRLWAPCFSYISTTDSHAPQKYKNIGYDNVIKTQWACNNFLYSPKSSELTYDVSFVGQPHSTRKKVIESLRNANISVTCFGNGWPEGRISQEEMITIFSQSKINLNLTKSSRVKNIKSFARIFLKKRGRFIAFNNLQEICGNIKIFFQSNREQIKGRNFEVPGCGGFLLTSEADNLSDYYTLGKEIVTYSSEEELKEKINYYLLHENERKMIAEAGYRRTLHDHTYEKRFNDIFAVIFS